MTQLERELKHELRLQEEIFRRELENVTKNYIENLKIVTEKYQAIMKEQKVIIDQQSQSLKKYENLPSSLQVTLREEPLEKLEEQVNILQYSINNMAVEYRELASGLESLQEKF